MHRIELVVLAVLFLAPACVLWVHALPSLLLLAPLLPDRDTSDQAYSRALSMHAALNAFALLVCTPNGLCVMLMRKRVQDHSTRIWLMKLHLAANVAATLLLSIAGALVFLAKRSALEPHFVSRHSRTGLVVTLLLLLNIFQGLVLTFEDARANWQWRDETHVLVGTLIYMGSAATLVFGIQSNTSAAALALRAEQQWWLVLLIVAAHAALLVRMAIGSRSSSDATKRA